MFHCCTILLFSPCTVILHFTCRTVFLFFCMSLCLRFMAVFKQQQNFTNVVGGDSARLWTHLCLNNMLFQIKEIGNVQRQHAVLTFSDIRNICLTSCIFSFVEVTTDCIASQDFTVLLLLIKQRMGSCPHRSRGIESKMCLCDDIYGCRADGVG